MSEFETGPRVWLFGIAKCAMCKRENQWLWEKTLEDAGILRCKCGHIQDKNNLWYEHRKAKKTA